MAELEMRKPDRALHIITCDGTGYKINGLGISFGSKVLRFLKPEICPVLDSRVSDELDYHSDVICYAQLAADCLTIAKNLQSLGVKNPMKRDNGKWLAADVDMALYAHINLK